MAQTTEPSVDVVIAVHNDRRPIERAVASVLRNRTVVRVNVVAHNVDADSIMARLGPLGEDERVRILPLTDGVRSPANAFNHGLDHATGEFVAIVGSDDELESGALDAWTALAARSGADAVVAPIVRDGGGGVPTPRVRASRFGRTADLDRDRLFERTAPLGLQRRSSTYILRYSTGLPRGVDQSYGLELWNSARVVFDPQMPAYLEHADQADRVTHVFGPLADDFVFVDTLLSTLEKVTPAVRRAVVAKILRVHLVPAVRVRAEAGSLTVEDRRAAADLMQTLIATSPRATGLLPRALRADLAAIGSASAPSPSPVSGPRSLAGMLPIELRATLHRHAPLRSQLAGRAVARQTVRASAQRRQTADLAVVVDERTLRIVVLAPHGSPIADRIREEQAATVIGFAGSGPSVEVRRPGALAQRVKHALGQSFPARLVTRVIGVDESTAFARSVARTPAARAFLDDADVVVAADEDAVFASWQSLRRGPRKTVVFGEAAASEAIAEWGSVR